MPSIESTQDIPPETVIEKFIWKIEAQPSAVKSLVKWSQNGQPHSNNSSAISQQIL